MAEQQAWTQEPGELLPCPFCGGEAERQELDDEANFGGTCIACKKCGASSPVHFDRKENLDSSWNERAPSAALPGLMQEVRETLTWFELFYERYGEDANERFERIASIFRHETGYLHPGKDCVIHDPPKRQEALDAWRAGKLRRARALLTKLGG